MTIPPQVRDNFSHKVKETLKMRAAYICSNPNCKIMTIAPSIEDENKIQYIGNAAHITAAAKGGPRYDEKMTEEQRMSLSNALFLCNNCATMIDKNNGIDYSKETLDNWKSDHENWVLDNLNKSAVGQQAMTVSSKSNNQSGGITANVVNVHGQINTIDDRKEHDRQVFKQADTILNEDDLYQIIDSLLGYETIWSKSMDKITEFKYYFEKTSTEYLDEEIETKKNELVDSLKGLLDFIHNEFDMYPYDQLTIKDYKLRMRPDLNIDMKGRELPGDFDLYTKIQLQHKNLVDNVAYSFKVYRKIIKSNLHV